MSIIEKQSASPILWQPNETWIEQSNIYQFAKQVNYPLFPYDRFHRWSIAFQEDFWSAVWDFANIVGDKGEKVLQRAEDDRFIGAKWFPNARLNYAENLLQGEDEQTAVIVANEQGKRQTYTYAQLREKVAKTQEGLKRLGVTDGDRVAGVVTNQLEALIALLATSALGATWTSCSPDFGPQGIIDRIGQVAPKVLFVTLEYQYNGKHFDLRENFQKVCDQIESIEAVITVETQNEPALQLNKQVFSWDELSHEGPLVPSYERVPFNHPLFILYTSGTTGLPKAILHSVGGTLIQHVKEHQLHSDLKPGDVLFWFTNTAWMMYPWIVSGLASKASVLLYDGAPLKKDQIGILWELAEDAGVTHFGTSPKYIDALMKLNYIVKDKHHLSKLRSVLSCGAPLSAEQFDWIYENIKSDMMLASISGGTEIIGCFVMGSPIHPVHSGEIACKALGMAVDIFDERGASVFHEKGELVCTKPFPSMPITFWGEGGDERYIDSYFSKRPGIWTHGDFAEQTIDQTIIIYGRSDTTLNPAGVRIGTAEIYRVIDQLPQVKDSIVFGLPTVHDEEVVLCVVTEDGDVDDELASLIRKNIRQEASPRHVPKRIFAVSDIPYTINGKKVEGAARSSAIGEQVKNIASLANPESLDEYTNLLDRSFK